MKLPTATITEVTNEPSESLFVINNSGQNSGQAGMILFTVKPGNDDSIGVMLPHTWAPFDLSTQVAKKYVLDNAQFRQAVSRGIIKLCLAKHALAFLDSDRDAAMENSRATQNIYGIERLDDVSKPRDTNEPPWLRAAREKLNQNQNSQEELIDARNEIEDGVNPRLKEAVLRSEQSGDLSEQDMYSLVRSINHDNTLKTEDINYILKNIKFEKVLTFVTNLNSKS